MGVNKQQMPALAFGMALPSLQSGLDILLGYDHALAVAS